MNDSPAHPSGGAQPRLAGGARHLAIVRVLLLEMAANLLVAAAKGAYGLWSGSLAVVSDAVHSLVDASANVIGLLVMRVAAAPPDRGHPYGHHKAEIVASAVVGFAVAGAAVEFAWKAITALLYGAEPAVVSPIGFVVVGGTWIVNIAIATWERRRGRELKSHLLLADAAHTATDVVVTGAVMLSLVAGYFGIGWADPVGTLVVVVVIGRVAWRIILSNLGVLLDSATVDANAIRAVAEKQPAVLQCHRVRSRGAVGWVYLDLHLLLDGALTLRQAHAIAHEVEDALKEAFPEVVDVVIHTEPEEAGTEGL